MNATEGLYASDDREAAGSAASPPSGDPRDVPGRPGLWLALLLRVLVILTLVYFVPE